MSNKTIENQNKGNAKTRMTPERLIEFEGFENYNLEDAKNTISELEYFAEIVCIQLKQIIKNERPRNI